MNKNNETTQINKQTLYKIPVWFKLSCMTISRAISGKYHLNKKDTNNEHYLTLTFEGINLKVPFSALFDTNNKLDGIPSISFSTAADCPSQKLGLCQLTDHNLCYALRGEKQANGIYTDRGFLKLNSYYKTVLDMEFIKTIKTNSKQLNKLYEYINANFEVVRFNKKGDFKNREDYLFLISMVLNCPNTKFYGYTARDDLFKDFEFNKTPNNFYLNGSNKMYTNLFITTTNLKDYLNSGYKCLGDCPRCKKCYTLQRKFIKCLLHGSNTDMYFNTFDNRDFLINFFNNNFKDLNLSHRDLKTNKGLLSSLNKAFKNSMYKEWNFKDYKELTNYIYAMGW